MTQPFGIRSEGIYRPAKPVRDPAYLKWIRALPCCVCGSQRGVEAAHTGSRGLSTKSCDRSCVPLCRQHHQTGKYSYHGLGARAFAARYGLDVGSLVGEFNAGYDSKVKTA